MKHTYDIAIVGLGTMGTAIAKNFINKGFSVSVFNRHAEKTEEFVKAIHDHGQNKDKGSLKSPKSLKSKALLAPHVKGCASVKELVAFLASPRKILLMVPAGKPVDEMMEQLLPLLSAGDIVMDGGNSNWLNTRSRQRICAAKKIIWLGVGISGGESGALNGPSIMVGGDKKEWEKVRPLLEKIAAKDFSKRSCAGYMGELDTGHFVKMIHNGIEYGIMQLIAETYGLLRWGAHLDNETIAQFFEKLNTQERKGYLLEIVPPILRYKEKGSKRYLLDRVKDAAGQKGTGKWTVEAALRADWNMPAITQAVYVRMLSAQKDVRAIWKSANGANGTQKNKKIQWNAKMQKNLEDAFTAAIWTIYIEGISLMYKHAETINVKEAIRVWQGGCIIRSVLLKELLKIAQTKEDLSMMNKKIVQKIRPKTNGLKYVQKMGLEADQPMPIYTTIGQTLLFLEQKNLPMNLIQAMRDAFGAHTYERNDKKGIFHTQWV